MHVCKAKTEKLSKHCYSVNGTFAKGALIIINNNKEFYSSEPIEVEGKRISEVIIQAIKNNEAIAARDTSVKYEKMGGA